MLDPHWISQKLATAAQQRVHLFRVEHRPLKRPPAEFYALARTYAGAAYRVYKEVCAREGRAMARPPYLKHYHTYKLGLWPHLAAPGLLSREQVEATWGQVPVTWTSLEQP